MRSSAVVPRGAGTVLRQRLTPEPERELPSDPVQWVTDDLDEFLWSMQRTIMRSVVTHRRTMVPAAHDVSKSHTASRIGAWWIAAHPPGDAFVVTSAPSDNQVRAILWRELGRAHRRGRLPGRINLAAEWFMGPRGAEELVAFGRKPGDLVNKEQAMTAFQGIHARYVLVILDEATGIPPWLWDATGSLLTNEGARLLAIGNPDDSESQFAKECAPGSGSNVIPISAYDSPNFTNEPVPEHLRELLVSQTWVEEVARKYGTDSPYYIAKVLGQFPDTSDNRVVTPRLVREAQARELPGHEPGAFGLDVARYGSDMSMLYRVRGGVARLVDEWRKTDTHTTRKRAAAHQAKVPNVPIVVDADGIGGGVYDELVAAGCRAWPYSVNRPAQDGRRFHDRRSEMWWSFREAMEDGEVDLDPDDDELAAQLQGPKWWLTARNKIQVETKKDMRKRGVSSPDRADAVIMAHLGAPARIDPDARERARVARATRPTPTAGLMKREM